METQHLLVDKSHDHTRQREEWTGVGHKGGEGHQSGSFGRAPAEGLGEGGGMELGEAESAGPGLGWLGQGERKVQRITWRILPLTPVALLLVIGF